MILDELTTFSSAQALTGAADSENTLDLGAAGVTVYPFYAYVGGYDIKGDLTATVKASATEGGTYAVVASGLVPAADLNAGKLIVMPLPPDTPRFVKVSYAGATAGTVNAGLAFVPQTNVAANAKDAN